MSAERVCGNTVLPFRAQCMRERGHEGPCSPARLAAPTSPAVPPGEGRIELTLHRRYDDPRGQVRTHKRAAQPVIQGSERRIAIDGKLHGWLAGEPDDHGVEFLPTDRTMDFRATGPATLLVPPELLIHDAPPPASEQLAPGHNHWDTDAHRNGCPACSTREPSDVAGEALLGAFEGAVQDLQMVNTGDSRAAADRRYNEAKAALRTALRERSAGAAGWEISASDHAKEVAARVRSGQEGEG